MPGITVKEKARLKYNKEVKSQKSSIGIRKNKKNQKQNLSAVICQKAKARQIEMRN